MFVASQYRDGERLQRIDVHNLQPQCFHLSDTNLCRVHETNGFRAKPETCRLFPFNYFRISAGHLLVGPHLGLCPLRASDEPAPVSDHSRLLDAMRDVGISSRLVTATCVHEDVGRLLELERAVALSGSPHYESGSYENYVADQVRLTAQHLGSGMYGDSESIGNAIKAISAVVDAMLGYVPRDSGLSGRGALKSMIAATPTLRMLLLFPDADRAVRRPLPPDRIPFVLLGVNKLVALAVDAGMTDVTFQTVLNVFQRYSSFVQLVAFANEVVSWSPSAKGYLKAADGESRENYFLYSRIARRILEGDCEPIGLLIAQNFGRSLVGRLDALESVSRRLNACVNVALTGRRALSAPSVARWILRNAPEDAIWRFANARRARLRRKP